MSGAMHPLPQYVFMAWCLVEHRDNLPYEHKERKMRRKIRKIFSASDKRLKRIGARLYTFHAAGAVFVTIISMNVIFAYYASYFPEHDMHVECRR
jgi:hypothetical protein